MVLGFDFRVLRTEHPKEPILKSRAQLYPSSPDSSSPMAQYGPRPMRTHKAPFGRANSLLNPAGALPNSFLERSDSLLIPGSDSLK